MRMGRAGSIAAALTSVNMLVTGVALMVAAAALGAYDRSSFIKGTQRNLSIEAQIIASTSISALVFNDPAAAEESLAALQAAPNIVAAQIYRANGRLFAQYQATPGSHAPVAHYRRCRKRKELGILVLTAMGRVGD